MLTTDVLRSTLNRQKEGAGAKNSGDEYKAYRPQEDELDLDEAAPKPQNAAHAYLLKETKEKDTCEKPQEVTQPPEMQQTQLVEHSSFSKSVVNCTYKPNTIFDYSEHVKGAVPLNKNA